MTTTNSQSSNYSEDIIKFQDLETDKTYTVKGFKAIDSKYGKSFISDFSASLTNLISSLI